MILQKKIEILCEIVGIWRFQGGFYENTAAEIADIEKRKVKLAMQAKAAFQVRSRFFIESFFETSRNSIFVCFLTIRSC